MTTNDYYLGGIKNSDLERIHFQVEMSRILHDSKLGALTIILTSPLWPARHDLPKDALPLYDQITQDAKEYALQVARDPAEALRIAGGWTQPLKQMMDSVRVADSEPTMKMLAVYVHYMDGSGIEWDAIKH